MARSSYGKRGLVVQKGGSGATEQQIRDLQTDLRQLGYLRSGIDGVFGTVTDQAVRALQHDLLHNYGKSSQNDGDAAVSVLDYNRGRVVQVTGTVEQGLAECISDMVDDPNFPKLPRSDNPKDENQRIVAIMRDIPSREVPIPFLMGMFLQESGLKHYNEPAGNDEDTYIVTGVDTNAN